MRYIGGKPRYKGEVLTFTPYQWDTLDSDDKAAMQLADFSDLITSGGTGEGGTGGGLSAADLEAAVALLQEKATAATDAELSAAVATINTALGTKQGAATAATDAELAAAVATLQAAATAATDAELASAVATLNTALSNKQDAATAATDAELAAGLATKQSAADAATDAELAAALLTVPVVWTPQTSYPAGKWVIAPGGYLASAKATFVSGDVYNPLNWNEFLPGAELAYGKNESGTLQPLSTVLADIPGCVIAVPQSPRPIWLEASLIIDVVTSPAAGNTSTVSIGIQSDVGGDPLIGSAIMPVEPGGTQGYMTVSIRCRIDPNTPGKTYRVQSNKGGNATFAASVMNGAIGAAFRSYIAAFSA